MPKPDQVIDPPSLATPPGASDLDPSYLGDPLYSTPAFSHGVRVGGAIYVAGQVAFDERGEIVGRGDPFAQAEQVWANIAAVVVAAGGQITDVVRATVFLADMADAAHELAARVERFGGTPQPAVTLVEAAGLALPELLMEIDAIAVVDSDAQPVHHQAERKPNGSLP